MKTAVTYSVLHDIAEAVKRAPHTYDELEVISGLPRETLERVVREMRGEGLMHVVKWSGHRNNVKHFSWSDGKPDAPRPTPKTAAERMRNTRARRAQKGKA